MAEVGSERQSQQEETLGSERASKGSGRGRLGRWFGRQAQRLREKAGTKRSEYPEDFQSDDQAVRAAKAATEALAAALRKLANSSVYSERRGTDVATLSHAAALGEKAAELADVLPEDSAYARELKAFQKALDGLAEHDRHLRRHLDAQVLADLKNWLSGPASSLVRERKALSEARLDMDARKGSASAKRRFEEQLALVCRLMEQVPGQLEEHRALCRQALRLLLRHSQGRADTLRSALPALGDPAAAAQTAQATKTTARKDKAASSKAPARSSKPPARKSRPNSRKSAPAQR